MIVLAEFEPVDATVSELNRNQSWRQDNEKIKMHAIARLYWTRTNVSSIAASALATKLNARKVDTIILFAVMHL